MLARLGTRGSETVASRLIEMESGALGRGRVQSCGHVRSVTLQRVATYTRSRRHQRASCLHPRCLCAWRGECYEWAVCSTES